MWHQLRRHASSFHTNRNAKLVYSAIAGASITAAAVLAYNVLSTSTHMPDEEHSHDPDDWTPPPRSSMLHQLKTTPSFDLLVIGGGATGTGVALDAATRGLNVALVERDDFSAGTSSRSTKLVHGGVRYLEKALLEMDYEQYKLVREALHERSVFLKIAPYLSYPLPIMIPIYKWYKIPYYWAGSKLYDLMAGGEQLEASYFLTKSRALEAFPMLKHDQLVGAMVYYDGQHNDSRMNVALALTAAKHGATVANHVEVVDFIKEEAVEGHHEPQIRGAIVVDKITGEQFTVRCKGVINATGPFSDAILAKAKAPQQVHEPIVVPSSGVHIILPNYYAPANMGLIDPATSDGRVIFFLPWQGSTIAGTTDSPVTITKTPRPKEEEIEWILGEVKRYLHTDVDVRRQDVLAAWSGIRPLVKSVEKSSSKTQALVRSHVVMATDSGLLTIAGGKWTTYRAMAQETVDEAIRFYSLSPPIPQCQTEHIPLVGTDAYTPTFFIRVIQRYGLETDVALHLANSYGDRAMAVAALAATTGKRWPKAGYRLASAYPFIDAEVRFACRHEYACTSVDVLARRTRLAFLNVEAAREALPHIVDIMSEELGWDEERQQEEIVRGKRFLNSMGRIKKVNVHSV